MGYAQTPQLDLFHRSALRQEMVEHDLRNISANGVPHERHVLPPAMLRVYAPRNETHAHVEGVLKTHFQHLHPAMPGLAVQKPVI